MEFIRLKIKLPKDLDDDVKKLNYIQSLVVLAGKKGLLRGDYKDIVKDFEILGDEMQLDLDPYYIINLDGVKEVFDIVDSSLVTATDLDKIDEDKVLYVLPKLRSKYPNPNSVGKSAIESELKNVYRENVKLEYNPSEVDLVYKYFKEGITSKTKEIKPTPSTSELVEKSEEGKAEKKSSEVEVSDVENLLRSQVKTQSDISVYENEVFISSEKDFGVYSSSLYSKEYEKFYAKLETDPSSKPPKEWFEKMKKELSDSDLTDRQVAAIIGSIWYHRLTDEKRKEIRERYGKTYKPLTKTEELVESANFYCEILESLK